LRAQSSERGFEYLPRHLGENGVICRLVHLLCLVLGLHIGTWYPFGRYATNIEVFGDHLDNTNARLAWRGPRRRWVMLWDMGFRALILFLFIAAVSTAGANTTQKYGIAAPHVAPHNARVVDVTNADDRSRIMSLLQKGMSSLGFGARIDGCSLVVRYYEDTPSGHDSSYGGVCNVFVRTSPRRLAMCDDVFVGKFALASWPTSREDLASFIAVSCPPGG